MRGTSARRLESSQPNSKTLLDIVRAPSALLCAWWGSAASLLLSALSVRLQLRAGIIYVPAGSDPGQFGHLLGGALQLVEQLPNPVFLVYDYVLHIAGGACACRLRPVAYAHLCTHT